MNEHTNALSRRAFIGGFAAAGAAGLAFSMNPAQAFGVTAAEKQAEAAATLDKLNAMQQKLDTASADYHTALAEQEAAQAKMDEAQVRIDEASSQISDLQDQLGTRARSMYRTGSLSFIDLLLSATSFKAFSNNWDLLNSMNESDAEMVEQTKALREEVETQKAEYAKQEAVAAEQAAQAAQVQAEAQGLVDQMQATYDSLSAEAAELLEQERAAREAEQLRQAQLDLQQLQQQPSGGGGGGNNTPAYNPPPYVPATGNAVVDRALAERGKPYVWGGVGPAGYDCSGLVSYALTGSHSRLGTTYTFMNWPQVSDPQPGDVCTNWDHCGIYYGGAQMIHAPTFGCPVEIGPVQGGMIYVRRP